ncbi:hypothetical protein CDAR_428801 [Caerostris darwini]|uniref:Uncharacterized protein n=1 Tax=Caerostris darwini TaxID=1538125 RepID=A0AAV4V570_9ARAC|nr:hypothetical protein CDAR_428801 [Caerostris darwini]
MDSERHLKRSTPINSWRCYLRALYEAIKAIITLKNLNSRVINYLGEPHTTKQIWSESPLFYIARTHKLRPGVECGLLSAREESLAFSTMGIIFLPFFSKFHSSDFICRWKSGMQ